MAKDAPNDLRSLDERDQGGERFSRLLELVEMAAEAPEVEFRWVSETYGMDYIATQRAVQAGGDVEPEDH